MLYRLAAHSEADRCCPGISSFAGTPTEPSVKVVEFVNGPEDWTVIAIERAT
jgi:hypothetical protein